jgi:hypothetical protein
MIERIPIGRFIDRDKHQDQPSLGLEEHEQMAIDEEHLFSNTGVSPEECMMIEDELLKHEWRFTDELIQWGFCQTPLN